MHRPFLLFLVFIALVASASAQWSTNPAINNPVTVATGDQDFPKMVGDGAGGTIITWQDYRNGGFDIYAQRLSPAGTPLWAVGGVPVSTSPNDQVNPSIASDGAGGAIIVWMDARNFAGTSIDVYAQRLNGSGVKMWVDSGVVVSAAPGNQFTPVLCSDGAGGAIISWVDFRTNAGGDIYAQRVSSSGAPLWTQDGVALSTVASSRVNIQMISDGMGGAILGWEDNRGATMLDIYAQRVNASGTPLWFANGVPVCIAAYPQTNLVVTDDGAHGALFAWQDLRNGVSNQVFAQRMNAVGNPVWTTNGEPVTAAANSEQYPSLVSDGVGGAIIVWNDSRTLTHTHIYAQRLGPSGKTVWGSDSVAVCVAAYSQAFPIAVTDGSGGVIVVWQDYGDGSTSSYLYAQRMSGSGRMMWASRGMPITTAAGAGGSFAVLPDGAGSAFVTWQTNRNGVDNDIFAQNIDPNGYLGDATPVLVGARDVSNDQGGQIRLLWNPSYLDQAPNNVVSSYAINIGVKNGGVLGKVSSSGPTTSGIFWQTALTVPARRFPGYTAVVATAADSGLQGIPYYYFQVVARAADSTVCWTSNVDSGYSIDNIPPVGIKGAAVVASGPTFITTAWNKDRSDPDLMGYRVYRSTTTGFALNGANTVALVFDTTYVDGGVTAGQKYYYRIAAVDVHGNVGAPSPELIRAASTTGISSGDKTVPLEFTLGRNYPNPFNPSTSLTFTVAASGETRLRVFDVLGQEVATLFDGSAESGRMYEVRFNANGLTSGIYFAVIESGGKQLTQKMLLVK